MYPVYSESYGFRSADGVDAHTCSSGTYRAVGVEGGHRHLVRGRLVRDGLAVVLDEQFPAGVRRRQRHHQRADGVPAKARGRFGHNIPYANAAVA
jgi:hypothetical protein